MPDAVAAAAMAAIQIIQQEPWRRQQLLQRANEVRQQFVQQGWAVPNGVSQIIPVVLHDPQRTLRAAAALRQQGVLVPAIRPPSVPSNQSMLRFSISYAHDPAALEALVAAMGEIRHDPSSPCSGA